MPSPQADAPSSNWMVDLAQSLWDRNVTGRLAKQQQAAAGLDAPVGGGISQAFLDYIRPEWTKTPPLTDVKPGYVGKTPSNQPPSFTDMAPMAAIEALGWMTPAGVGKAAAVPFLGGALRRGEAALSKVAEGNRGSLGPATLGAQLGRDTAATAPPVSLKTGTIEEFLQQAKIPFRKEHSRSEFSPSTYFYIDTPSGQKKLRVSDHDYPSGADADLRFGLPLQPQLDRLGGLLGIDVHPGAAKDADIARLNTFLNRWPDSHAVPKWRDELEKLQGENGIAQAAERTGIRAYHGSPHDFDRFDLSKIGTGEGAQAYGHGLYFADNEGVARSYRDRLTKADVIRPDEEALAFIRPQWDAIVEKLRAARAKSHERMTDETAALQNHLDALNESAIDDTLARKPWLKQGRMYEVNINAHPDQFLDWDKPLSQQSEAIRGAGPIAPFVGEDAALRNRFSGGGSGEMTGQNVMTHLAQQRVGGFTEYNYPHASAALREAGIPGIKYLDQGSRGAGEGSRNYVVFDDKLIDILKKYGIAGLGVMPPAVAAAVQSRMVPVDHNPFEQ